MTAVLLGDVRTQGSPARAEAVALRDGRVLAVGARDEVLTLAGEGARVHDTRGVIAPGFVDPHHHPSLVALYGGVVQLSTARDLPSLLGMLRDASTKLPPGAWLVGMDWNEGLLAEQRPPTLRELDEAVPDRPLFAMHFTCHRGLANSRALALAGTSGSREALLIERAMSPVETLARADLVTRDVEGFLARLDAHHRALLAVGITHVVDATVPTDLLELYREAARRGALRVPTTAFPVSVRGYLEEPRGALDGPRTGHREGALAIGSIKLVLDGAPVCAMCLGWWQVFGSSVSAMARSLREGRLAPIRAALASQPRVGWKARTGVLMYGPEQAQSMVREATERGFSVAAHAVGNEASDVILGALEAVGPELRPRIEHATFLDRALIARLRRVNAAVVTQPAFLRMPMMADAPSIPGIASMPLRALLDEGVPVAISSDHPVVGMDPLDGVRAAVRERSITLDEALAMITRVAAAVSGEHDKGSLEPGKRADLVVLDGEGDALSVRATLLGGELVYGSLEA